MSCVDLRGMFKIRPVPPRSDGSTRREIRGRANSPSLSSPSAHVRRSSSILVKDAHSHSVWLADQAGEVMAPKLKRREIVLPILLLLGLFTLTFALIAAQVAGARG